MNDPDAKNCLMIRNLTSFPMFEPLKHYAVKADVITKTPDKRGYGLNQLYNDDKTNNICREMKTNGF